MSDGTGVDFMSTDMARSLVKQPHFWCSLAMVAMGALQASGFIPAGKWMQLSAAGQVIIGWIGYQLGVSWSPPRRPWTDAERIAKGLPPQYPPRTGE